MLAAELIDIKRVLSETNKGYQAEGELRRRVQVDALQCGSQFHEYLSRCLQRNDAPEPNSELMSKELMEIIAARRCSLTGMQSRARLFVPQELWEILLRTR